MGEVPNFRVDTFGSLVEELYRFYQKIEYPVNFAYVRVRGLCACGDTACTRDPHLIPEGHSGARIHANSSDAESTLSIGWRLVMPARNALVTNDVHLLNHIVGDHGDVPILRHGSTVYIFVRNASDFPDLSPVLGSQGDSWLSLPPCHSDAPSGSYDLPAWLAPLTVGPDQLPSVKDLFDPRMLSRIAQLRAIGVELLERAGQGALPLDQIITYALGDLSTEGTEGDLLALLAAACVGEFITVGQAQRLLEHSAPERLPAAIYSTLFADGNVETDELLETLYEAAVAMIADGEGFDDLEVDADTPRSTGEINANAETTGELSPTTSQDIDQGRESESVIVSAEAFLDEIVDSEGRFTLDDADEGTTDEIASDEIDWAQALDGVDASTLTPLRLVAIMRSMDDLALPKTPLASLALLDMTLTAISAAPKYPCELLEYIWPTHQTLLDDFGDHMVVVQLLAGVLLRFEMMCDAGLLMPDTNLLDQLFHIDTVSLLSDLFGAPDIVFWVERHVLGGTPEQLTARIHKVADVLDTVGVEIIPDVSTAYYLELIGENP